jgi:hypothetical protein
MSVRSEFTVVAWERPSEHSAEVWPQRIERTLEVVLEHTAVDRLLRYDEEYRPHEVAVGEGAIAALVREGQEGKRPEGVLGLTGTGPGGVDEWWVRIRFTLGDLLTGRSNSATIGLPGPADPSEAPGVFHDCLKVWHADWGCIQSERDIDLREQEVPAGESLSFPLERMLHWVTWFGPGRTKGLALQRLERREDVAVREVRGGVEVSVGAQWPGAEVLRDRQRELEPLLFDDHKKGPRGVLRRLRGP